MPNDDASNRLHFPIKANGQSESSGASDEPLDEQREPAVLAQQREILRSINKSIASHRSTLRESEQAYERTQAAALEDMNRSLERLSAVAKHIRGLVAAGEQALAERGKRGVLGQQTTGPGTARPSTNVIAQLDAAREEAGRALEDVKKHAASQGSGGVFVWVVGLAALVGVVGLQVPGGELVGGISMLVAVGVVVVWIMSSQNSSYQNLVNIAAGAEELASMAKDQVTASYNARLSEVRERCAASVESSRAELVRTVEAESPRMAELSASMAEQAQDWAQAHWDTWNGPTNSGVIRLGRCSIESPEGRLPESLALYAFPGDKSLVLKASGPAKASAIECLQSTILRLLASQPAGKMQLTFLDPVGLGQSVAAFMRLADDDESLVTSRAWSEPQHIEQRLAEITEHMENVIQKYLRNEFRGIEEYNATAGEVAEAYRILVVTGFPMNFGDVAARRLNSIVMNGPRCGVYTLMMVDTDLPLPYGFNIEDLERHSLVAQSADSGWTLSDPDFQHCIIDLDKPATAAICDKVLQHVGQGAREAKRVEVPFSKVAPPTDHWWSVDSTHGLSVPLGPAGARKLQKLELGHGTAQHLLIAGKTGSGKSNLLHVMIVGLAMSYGPEELELYLIDFKKGVEFKTYASHALPHARVIAIESEREFGLSVLQGLDNELKARAERFRGAALDSLADYRTKTGNTMPRILLVVDEFQEFFTEDDAVASQAAQILDRLVRQGRSFGVHVVLGSQTLAGAYSLARSTIDQMGVRIALQCSEADSRLILADDNHEARLLSRPGEAIYNAANGAIEGNHRFQAAMLDDDDERSDYIDRLRARDNRASAQPMIVFEGNSSANPGSNKLLRDAWQQPSPAVMPRAIAAWLGEPIAIKDPTAAVFRRQSGGNLLVVGLSEELGVSVLVSALLSVAAQLPSQRGGADDARFFILDFTLADSEYRGLLARLPGVIQEQVQVGGRRQLPDFLQTLSAELERRIENEDGTHASIYLAIVGLQRARDLHQDDDLGFRSYDSAPEAPSPAKLFSSLVREGPDVGIHVLTWCDTLNNLTRTVDRRTLREFAMRVAMQMSAEDSSNLIDSPAASKLGPFRAILLSEDEGRMEKFRPYGPPDEDFLAWIQTCAEGR